MSKDVCASGTGCTPNEKFHDGSCAHATVEEGLKPCPFCGTDVGISVNWRDGMPVRQVLWCEPDNSGFEIWSVDDNKHGPFALRGYINPYPTHWMPLPAPPALGARRDG